MLLNCSNSKSSIWRKRNGRKPLPPVQNAKLTLNNNYSINVILFAVMLANIVLVIWQSLNYVNQYYFIFRLQANRGRPLWSLDTSSKMAFGIKCKVLHQVKILIVIIDLSEYLRRYIGKQQVLMLYLGKFFSVALQSSSFHSAIALLTTADIEIQISRNNSNMYISAFSDTVTCLVEKMELIGCLLYLLHFLLYLWCISM